MTAAEIKARLEAADPTIVATLRENGFTEAEILRQCDVSLPDAVRTAELEAVMARKFVADLKDPSSNLVQTAIADVMARLPELEKELAAQRARRRKRLALVAALALVIAGAGIWYFVLRDARSACTKIIGSLDDLGREIHTTLKPGLDMDDKRGCELMIDDEPFHGTVIHIEVGDGRYYDQLRRSLDGAGFARSEKLDIANGWLWIVDTATQRSSEEILADAKSRIGRSRDPMGDALAASGPTEHTALFEFGARRALVKFSSLSFTPAQARAAAIAMATRAKRL